MSAPLTPNKTTTIALNTGFRIKVDGVGAWQFSVVPASGLELDSGVCSGPDVIGPFASAVSVQITPVVGSQLSYSSDSDDIPASIQYPTGPVGAYKAVLFGSSTDQHCFCNAEGTLTVSNGVGTLVSGEGNHLLADGALVSLNKDSPTTDFQRRRATVRATYVNATTLRFDLPGWPNGSGAMDCHYLTAYAQPSWVRKLRSLTGGNVDIVATMAVGGEQTKSKLTYFRDILGMSGVNMVIGAFGIGNDLLGGVDPAETIANMDAMISELTNSGLVVVVHLPPATGSMTVIQDAAGRKIINALTAMRASNPRLYLVDVYSATIDPATGQGKAALFINDGVHMNRLGKDIEGTQSNTAIAPLMQVPISSQIASLKDCKRQSPNSGQVIDGFWVNTGTDASTLSGKATGTVDASITSIEVGGASAVLACSLVARADGFGYDQVLQFTPGGNNQSFLIRMKGAAGFEFWRNIAAGDYDVSCSSSIAPDSGLEIIGYAHYVAATVNGNSGRLSEAYRTENGVNNESKMTYSVEENPCIFPKARVTAAPTDFEWVFALNTGARGAAGNKVIVKIGRPTMRLI